MELFDETTEHLPPQKRHPKLFHKKSRTGCMRCRERRVKCDEGKPVCANCTRLELHCEYGGVSARTRSSNRREPDATSPSVVGSISSQASPAGDPTDPPESAVRRRLELELLYHYATETGPSIPTDGNSAAFWGPVMCRFALKSDAVLYTICLLAAVHKAHTAGIMDMDSVDDISTYLSMAIREHHKDVTNLHPDNVDCATLASNGLRLYSLIRLQHRSLAPYTPPIDWLRVTGTSNIVFRRAYNMVQDRPDSISLLLLSNAFQLMAEKSSHKYLDELKHLLRREESHELEEFWNDEVDGVYKSTLSIIGAVWKFRRVPEPPTHLARRLIIFPMIVDHQFIDYIEEQRPRALVILAHYFALLNMLRRQWHIGNAGFREAWAIVNAVPPEWNEMLREPIEMLENPAAYGEVVKTSAMQDSPLSRH